MGNKEPITKCKALGHKWSEEGVCTRCGLTDRFGPRRRPEYTEERERLRLREELRQAQEGG